MTEIWRPSATVAAVIEREGKFLFVEDFVAGGRFPIELFSKEFS